MAWLILRAVLYSLALPGTVTVLVPWLIVRSEAGRFDLSWARYFGTLPCAVGAAGLVWCIADFVRIGRGTLATVDPPRVLVVRGLYRWVRNPMYVSVVLILAGETLLFQTWILGIWMAVALLAFHLFVILYEEPHLAKTFGADYESYRRSVRRWVPFA